MLASVGLLPICAIADEPQYFTPQLLGAQYTLVAQHQDALTSPYSGPLSLRPAGDSERSHTFGAYLGVALAHNLQFYFDEEMFKGEPVSAGTGLGGGANGDVVHAGSNNLGKRAYAARHFVRYLVPLGTETSAVEAAQDQLAGDEPVRRIELKAGKLAASDDFDRNRYANGARTQFLNVALMNDVAWDFAADTRGYTNGAVVAYVAPQWSLRYGIYQMPAFANGQTLEWPLSRARGEQVELTIQPVDKGWALRLLAFQNLARMGIYREAIAQADGGVPDIRADDQDGRRKTGYAANAEIPLADAGETGVFVRAGRNDGRTESFAFTEADKTLSAGLQLASARWRRAEDGLGLAVVENSLSPDHRDYLALGGSGFLLGDGHLNYARESIAEIYYRAHLIDHVDLSPDFEFIRAPGYNRDRGPARFLGLRLHLQL